MGYKYCCDDCGAELGKSDNVASQLDMTGHAYCCKCYPNYEKEREPKVYKYTNEDRDRIAKNIRQKMGEDSALQWLGGINGG